jgi:hypothetical protein
MPAPHQPATTAVPQPCATARRPGQPSLTIKHDQAVAVVAHQPLHHLPQPAQRSRGACPLGAGLPACAGLAAKKREGLPACAGLTAGKGAGLPACAGLTAGYHSRGLH